MRLTSELWVKSYLRRCSAAGIFALVFRHGDDERGTIFIKVRRQDGKAALLGPAPAGLSAPSEHRRWAILLDAAPEAEADSYLTHQAEFDSDLWLVEIEDRAGRHLLDDELVVEPSK